MGCGPCRVRGRWRRARLAAGRAGEGLGCRHRRPPERLLGCSLAVDTRTASARSCASDERRGHDLPARPRLPRPPPARHGHVHGHLVEDLVRRDFTVNAIAWGGRAAGEPESAWVDPTGGLLTWPAGVLRAVGEPKARFDEDALRLLRAARLAAQLEFDDRTGDARRDDRCGCRRSSGSRGADRRGAAGDARGHAAVAALRDPADTGPARRAVCPELAAQRGMRPGQVDRASTSGGTRWRRSMPLRRWRRMTRCCGSPRCCTTSASPRRSPTDIPSATSGGRAAGRAAARRGSRFRAAKSTQVRRAGPPSHVQLRAEAGATRRFDASSVASDPGWYRSCSPCVGRIRSGAGSPRTPGTWRSSRRGWPLSWNGTCRSPWPIWRSTAMTSSAKPASRPARAWARSWNGSWTR